VSSLIPKELIFKCRPFASAVVGNGHGTDFVGTDQTILISVMSDTCQTQKDVNGKKNDYVQNIVTACSRKR
jgi:hypothetical protein